MVGFVSRTVVEEQEDDGSDQASNPKGTGNPLALLDQKIGDLSFTDSFLDFESIQNWFEDVPMDPATVLPGSFDGVKVEEGYCGREGAGEVLEPGSELKPGACEAVTAVLGSVVKVEKEEWEKVGTLGGSIEDNMGRVSLGCGSGVPVVADGICVKTEVGSDDGGGDRSLVPGSGFESGDRVNAVRGEQMIGGDRERGSSSESDGSSSTSSSSSSSSDEEDDDDDDGNRRDEERERMGVKGHVEEVGEMEEGEIREVDGGEESGEEKNDDNDDKDSDEDGQVVVDMVSWSDVEDEEDGVAGTGAKGGPIRSKNEVKALPPVPPVNATLQPHHQMSPVGVVLSMLGAQVIVEGVEKHSPLNEGSILWITETRTPLGLVDEIFGPVKNPYYIVRYNSEAEVPVGIHQGTLISSIPEFASYVLNEKYLYKKGYDASGENDEEVSEEAEFSDDEKEAEYRRMQRMAKRGTNMDDQRAESRKNNKKKVRSRESNWKNGKPPPQQMPAREGQPVLNQTQHHISPTAPSLDYGNFATSSAIQPGNMGGIGTNSPFPLMQLSTGSILPLHGAWANGLPLQQPMGAIFSNGIPNGMPWPPRGSQFPFQMPLPNQMPFQQQFDLSQGLLPNMVLPMGQSNTLGPGLAPWPNPMGQNECNQMTVGVGAFGQSSHPIFNAGGQGFQFNGSRVDQSGYTQPPAATASPTDAPGPFKQRGPSFGHGKKPYRGRGGRFSGGRSQRQPH
ncbi:H/ACA ribonucleoprotein complex non-core subunit NAF1-like [Syzygium oleosum]|uniref:H/ACA ribonucleoprotein complex non-core subunit NAF1-like n=1 Tax=Syzygium oleosum TaxID=219896 RepID=UPI0011D2BDE1|nr:H/ACA ribonucleoprotein complex non-core subunit NAF1-like [Syzygium oleosum]